MVGVVFFCFFKNITVKDFHILGGKCVCTVENRVCLCNQDCFIILTNNWVEL